MTTPVIVRQPVVVAQPVCVSTVEVQQDVWIPGYYTETVRANGTVERVWVPGHYENPPRRW